MSHKMPFAAGSRNKGLHSTFPTQGRFGGESVADKVIAREKAERARQMTQTADGSPQADVSLEKPRT